VDDLARWSAAILRRELLDGEHWRQAFTTALLNDGRDTRYAAGWSLGTVGRFETVEHSGGIHGFSANGILVPEAELFVAVLANADAPVSSVGEMSLRLAELVLGPDAVVPAVPVAEARLREYVGVYRIDENATRTISLEDGRLWSQRSGGDRLELRPIGDDEFLIVRTHGRIRFERDGAAITGMVLTPRSGLSDRARRTDEAPAAVAPVVTLPAESYAAYPGTYRLAPSFDIVVTREGQQLYARATGQGRVTLRPESPTRFRLAEVDAVLEFEIVNGRAVALTLHQGGRSTRGSRVD
jgi:hypothetical protein